MKESNKFLQTRRALKVSKNKISFMYIGFYIFTYCVIKYINGLSLDVKEGQEFYYMAMSFLVRGFYTLLLGVFIGYVVFFRDASKRIRVIDVFLQIICPLIMALIPLFYYTVPEITMYFFILNMKSISAIGCILVGVSLFKLIRGEYENY